MTFQLHTDKNPFQFHIIYVGMNPLKKDASTRTKEDIDTIRHLYVDLDYGGPAALEAIHQSDLVPQPNYVLDTSPGKHQVVGRAMYLCFTSFLHFPSCEFQWEFISLDRRISLAHGFTCSPAITRFPLLIKG